METWVVEKDFHQSGWIAFQQSSLAAYLVVSGEIRVIVCPEVGLAVGGAIRMRMMRKSDFNGRPQEQGVRS